MINGLTDVGLLRDLNEDSYFIKSEGNKFIVAVSDGMGGHNAGDVASKLAVDAIKEFSENNNMYENTDRKIRLCVLQVNEKIFLASTKDKKKSGMGATVVLAVGNGKEVVIGNIGDSRAYVLNEKTITQITEDHSYVNELVKSGMITKDEAKIHPKRNEILKAVGIGGDVFPDIFKVKMKKSESLLLCTDGLTNMVEDSEIHRIVNEDKENSEILKNLIGKALENGGSDNITAVLLKNKKGEQK